MLLFRPVGLNELRLIVDAKFRAFPPRLPEQPIFYEFNANMTGPIEVIEYFTGPKFVGAIDPQTCLPEGWLGACD